MRRISLVFSAVLLAACSQKPDEAAIAVTISVGDPTPITCVRVFVHPSTGADLSTDGILLKDKRELHVAIYRGAGLSGDVSVTARGFVGDGCNDPSLLYEESAAQSAAFKDGEVTQVALALQGKVSGDNDGDGYRGTQSGGDDCDDADIDVHPNARESCANGKDDDCKDGADCTDPFCAGALCSDGDACTEGESCSQLLCTGGQPKVCNQSPGECFDAVGTCDAQGCNYAVKVGAACSTGICRSDGVCVPVTVEVLCGDGQDNDGDTRIDCADSDCDQQSCTDNDPCTGPDLCGGGSCGTQPITCTTPPNGCFASPGSCSGGDCSYTQNAAGSACGSGNNCAVDGGCLPAETGATLCSDGIDNDQDGTKDCADTSCGGSLCNDSSVCTTTDTCANGACSGTAITCTPPTACHVSNGACDPAAGCSYSVNTGGGCPGGKCLADAGCDPFFKYPPSNFNPSTLSSPGAATTINCSAQLSTDSTNYFPSWCGSQPKPSVVNVTSNGNDAVMFVFDSLTINGGNSLTLVGSKPAIIAVLGNATINGTLSASSDHDVTRGAGGSYPYMTGVTPKQHCINTLSLGRSGQQLAATGGGGGGAFGGLGGTGGDGHDGADGGVGGAVFGTPELVPLVGGCNGGNGGLSDVADHGGAGGGALQLSVGGTLTISGTISAAGGGGSGGDQTGNNYGGAGGGGSGGAILLEGNSVSVSTSARITANGGAGGEGDGNNGGAYPGADGANGNTTSGSVTPGADGGATANGGPGGDGAAGTTVNGGDGQNGSPANGNGGGGGGGVGRIRINSATSCTFNGSYVVSPANTSNKAACQ